MHDYSNTIICINGLLNENKITECKKYLSEISVNYKNSNYFIKTGNSLIDVLINNKYQIAVKKKIVMTLSLSNLSNINVKNSDLIVILSNLLDNAINASNKLKKEDKIINLSIKNNKDNLIITVINEIENKIIIKDNLIETTKNNKSNHGIGLINVRDCVKKYNGNIIINASNNKFTYLIKIPKNN